jgi:hypothetical protein
MLQGKMLAPDSVGKFQKCVNIYMYMYHDNTTQVLAIYKYHVYIVILGLLLRELKKGEIFASLLNIHSRDIRVIPDGKSQYLKS